MLFFSFFIGLAREPVVNYRQRRGIRRGVGTFMVMGGLILSAVAFFVVFGALLGSQYHGGRDASAAESRRVTVTPDQALEPTAGRPRSSPRESPAAGQRLFCRRAITVRHACGPRYRAVSAGVDGHECVADPAGSP
ncbi:MAG TPA: hypothetical protein VLQ92_10105 [Candidatus Limnocylindrales bacterium]|nr:hypothetical protein [Candidatus Limnocylindrales bacterium]